MSNFIIFVKILNFLQQPELNLKHLKVTSPMIVRVLDVINLRIIMMMMMMDDKT